MERGLIVDIETTGLDAKKDVIIEIGVICFVMDSAMHPTIVSMYSGLEDPGRDINEEIQRITGLTTEILNGQVIDWSWVRRAFADASIVIAHNDRFERQFLESHPKLEGLAPRHWACSMRHIPWRKLGFRTQALNYLAADHGFANPFAHRALFDCATTFRLLAPHLDELIRRSCEREVTLLADGAPFEAKDLLRGRGYRWDPERRVWLISVLESELDEERTFLSSRVYGERPDRHREEVSDILSVSNSWSPPTPLPPEINL